MIRLLARYTAATVMPSWPRRPPCRSGPRRRSPERLPGRVGASAAEPARRRGEQAAPGSLFQRSSSSGCGRSLRSWIVAESPAGCSWRWRLASQSHKRRRASVNSQLRNRPRSGSYSSGRSRSRRCAGRPGSGRRHRRPASPCGGRSGRRPGVELHEVAPRGVVLHVAQPDQQARPGRGHVRHHAPPPPDSAAVRKPIANESSRRRKTRRFWYNLGCTGKQPG